MGRSESTMLETSSNDNMVNVERGENINPRKHQLSLPYLIIDKIRSIIFNTQTNTLTTLPNNKQTMPPKKMKKTAAAKAPVVLAYVTQGKTEHMVTVVDPTDLSKLKQDSEIVIKWSSTGREQSVIFSSIRLVDVDDGGGGGGRSGRRRGSQRSSASITATATSAPSSKVSTATASSSSSSLKKKSKSKSTTTTTTTTTSTDKSKGASASKRKRENNHNNKSTGKEDDNNNKQPSKKQQSKTTSSSTSSSSTSSSSTNVTGWGTNSNTNTKVDVVATNNPKKKKKKTTTKTTTTSTPPSAAVMKTSPPSSATNTKTKTKKVAMLTTSSLSIKKKTTRTTTPKKGPSALTKKTKKSSSSLSSPVAAAAVKKATKSSSSSTAKKSATIDDTKKKKKTKTTTTTSKTSSAAVDTTFPNVKKTPKSTVTKFPICNQLFHGRGLQHWNLQFQTIPHLLECVASRGDYEKMKKKIVNLDSFGKDCKVYPLLHPKENLIHFCRFRCLLNPNKCKLIKYVNDSERNKRVGIYDCYEPRYFEAVAKLNDNLYVFTIREKHLRLIDGVDVNELIYVHANHFTDIRLGEKGDQPNDQFDINSESTILNVFSHKHNNYKSLCVLGTFCAAISALGFPDKAMEMFHAHKDTLHQGTINLWYLVEKEYHNYIKTAELRSISTPGGIDARQLLNMYDGWPIILSIMSTKGKRSHFICICNGLIYDTNSDTVLLKTNENLDKCAQLHQFGSDDTFHKSHRVYRFLAINLGVTGKPLWNMVLPKREGWEFQDKRLCFLCKDKKYAEEYSLSQWKKAFLKKGKCKQCSAA